MNSLSSFFLLTVSIILAGMTSRKTLRLYFWAQLCCTLALFIFTEHKYYTYVYLASDILMLELCSFLLMESKVNRFTIRLAATFGAFCTAIACFGVDAPNFWIVLIEGGVFSALGMAMMLCGETIPVLSIGTLTLAMSVYDFGWVSNESWRLTNGWAPSFLCTVTFLLIAAWNVRTRNGQDRDGFSTTHPI